MNYYLFSRIVDAEAGAGDPLAPFTLLDVDRRPNGNYIMVGYPTSHNFKFLVATNKEQFANETGHVAFEVDPEGRVLWEKRGLGFPHEIDEVGDDWFLIADTMFDRVVLLNSTTGQFDWTWRPAEVNWTALNSSWGPDHYYNNPTPLDWTHLNDVDLVPGTLLGLDWHVLLVSIRNFDLVVMVNWTAELAELRALGDTRGNTTNVFWWFGPGVLSHQHNPSVLPNGHVVISDSENNRILEVDPWTKEVTWSVDHAGSSRFHWPRDATYDLLGDKFYVTDSSNNRIVRVDREGDVDWTWTQGVLVPYETDLLEDGHLLVSGCGNGVALEVDPVTGKVAWSYAVRLDASGVAREGAPVGIAFPTDIYAVAWYFNFSFIGASAGAVSVRLSLSLRESLRARIQGEKGPTKRSLVTRAVALAACVTIVAVCIYCLVETSDLVYRFFSWAFNATRPNR